jgi:hypothetical protein
LAKELIERKAWMGLGYPNMQAYCEAELDGVVLPVDTRREVVADAVLSGLSIRAAAMIAGTSERTARRDLAISTAAPAAVQPERNSLGADNKVRSYPNRSDGPPVTPRNQRTLVGNVVHMPQRHIVEPPDLDLSDEPDYTCVKQTLALMEDWLLPEDLLRPLASRVQSQIGRLAAGEER